eukprot:TRINITY_DN3205_c0_g1_i2.p1 TRINITY_DN3205_c0_g1~~TRINITY_DN3205_c0_g1_i2.p1  ORF type:complete len:180 (-),score=33.72 TRINITY_DN3205_c0_g1_i2:96-635(-)
MGRLSKNELARRKNASRARIFSPIASYRRSETNTVNMEGIDCNNIEQEEENVEIILEKEEPEPPQKRPCIDISHDKDTKELFSNDSECDLADIEPMEGVEESKEGENQKSEIAEQNDEILPITVDFVSDIQKLILSLSRGNCTLSPFIYSMHEYRDDRVRRHNSMNRLIAISDYCNFGV